MRGERFSEKFKGFVREAVDVPEKVAIAVGAGGVILSIFQPALLPASLFLIGGGYASMKVTEAAWPKKGKVFNS